MKASIHIELLKFKDGIRHIDQSLDAGHISEDEAHRLKNRLAAVYAAHIAHLVEGEMRIRLPCRVCEVARATGDDGLCDGCRGHRILRRIKWTSHPTCG